MKVIGINFFGLLTLLFIGLKLTGYIDWGWIWVLGPLWIPTAVVTSIFLILALGSLAIVGISAFAAMALAIIRR